MIKQLVRLGKAALTVRKAVTTVTKPAQAVRDVARETAVKAVIATIVMVAGRVLAQEKIEKVLNWEKQLNFTIPTDKKMLQWLSDPETHTTLLDLINQGLQIPLALYGVTPAQLEAVPTENGQLQVNIKLKVHKNSELK